MLNFDFLEEGPGIVSQPQFVYDFQEICLSCYILLIDQVSLSYCLYFLRCRVICVLQLFISQFVRSCKVMLKGMCPTFPFILNNF